MEKQILIKLSADGTQLGVQTVGFANELEVMGLLLKAIGGMQHPKQERKPPLLIARRELPPINGARG